MANSFDSRVAPDCHAQIPIQLEAPVVNPELADESEKVSP